MKPRKVKLNNRNVIYVATRDAHPVMTTDVEIGTAIERGKNDAPNITAVQADYDPTHDKIRVSFDNGADVGFPRARLQGLEHATAAQLAKVEIEGPGTGLYWPALDVAHYLPGLLEGIYGSRSWMATLGKKGGSATSLVKTVAARANGKKGGRPPHTAAMAAKGVPSRAHAKKTAKGGKRKKSRP